MTTTIKINKDTKSQLDTFREYKNESYDELVKKMIYIAQNVTKQPQLSKKAVQAIHDARARRTQGNIVTEEEAKKRLGL